uniref:C2H2-type domain-containing protein n=1 Tax=Zonotrichia albicollis TaxID=44394 RepID=A0A8D2MT94_ZONAL
MIGMLRSAGLEGREQRAQASRTCLLKGALCQQVVPAVEESITVAHIVVEASSIAEEISDASAIVGSGHIKEVIVAGDHVFENPNGHVDGEVSEEQDVSSELTKVKLQVNKEGRYVCELCQKTFKTVSIPSAVSSQDSVAACFTACHTSQREASILKAHMITHSNERPYKCKKCGKSFRESGALTRHLKSLTPCTEKIRFNMTKEIVVNKDDLPPGSFLAGPCSSTTDTVSSIASESIEASPVIHFVTDAKGNVLHEVHVQMQGLPVVDAKPLEADVSVELPCEGEVNSENLLRQFCSRGFREKGSLVRHIRHHTGEKPFKCYKCGRGFAEHGTLNRHLRTKGGCLLAMKEVEEVMVSEESQSADNLAATVLSEDPHTVLVEFSSVVADTQEYIIEVRRAVITALNCVSKCSPCPWQVDSHIMKVVQQIVNQANSGHQIIVQNVTEHKASPVSPELVTEQLWWELQLLGQNSFGKLLLPWLSRSLRSLLQCLDLAGFSRLHVGHTRPLWNNTPS